MYPPPFEYVKAETLTHALDVLATRAPNAQVLAGGQSLLALLKLRTVNPGAIVDISGLSDLAYVHEQPSSFDIGALTRHVDMLTYDWPKALSVLHDAASVIGDVQVRNRGTVCGALAHADPVGDWGPVLSALNATAHICKRGSVRDVPVSELFVEAFQTVVGSDEILTSVSMPTPRAGSTSAYLKLGRRIGDFGLVSVAISLTMDGDVCRSIGIGVGGVGATPIKASEAEAYISGNRLDDTTLDNAAALIQGSVIPLDDVRASADYRLAMIPIIFKRAVRAAHRRSAGEVVAAGYV